MDSVILDDSQSYYDTYRAIFDDQMCMTVLYSNVTHSLLHTAMGIMGIQPLTNVKQAPPVENESHPTVGICESQIASCFGFTKRGLERPNVN